MTIAVGLLIDEVHNVPSDDGWLSEWERERLAKLRMPKRRADWRLGRFVGKRALAAWLGRQGRAVLLPQLEIRTDEDGAPEAFVEGQRPGCVISLSHRAGRAACTVTAAHVALGCDLEVVEPRSEAFLRDYFTPGEQDLVRRVPETERSRMANLLWSAKESTLKALRSGLRMDTQMLEVRIEKSSPFHSWRPLEVACAEPRRLFPGWWHASGDQVMTMVGLPRCDPPHALQGGEPATGTLS